MSQKSPVFCLFLLSYYLFLDYSSFQLSSHPILSAQSLVLLSLEPTRPVFATNRVGWNFGGRSLQTHKALARVINARRTPSRKERTWTGGGRAREEERGG